MTEKCEETWLLGVSGGCDSMALFYMCLEKHVPFMAAHVNYHQRPEADEEEEYVRAQCALHGIPFFALDKPFDYTGNFEAAAREYRYRYFVSLVKEHHLAGILIAHHEDDLLETYLMQKEKKIIPSYYGLKEEGMYHDVRVRRPLLKYSRKDLEQYCQKNHIRYYIDSTNLEDVHTRNRIRHSVVSDMSKTDRRHLRQEISENNEALRKCRADAEKCIDHNRCPIALYKKQNPEIRCTILRMLISEAGQPSLKYIRQMDHIIMNKNDFMIPYKGLSLVRNHDELLVVKRGAPYSCTYSEIQKDRKEYFVMEEVGKSTEAVTVSKDDLPITVRSPLPKDKIQMHFGTKSLHRFFIDRHIPRYLREVWPVVVNAKGTIILVPGLGCTADHYTTKPNLYVIQYFPMEVCRNVGNERH